MIKKGKQSVTKQLERCLSQRFFETNQCLIFHGFAVTKTEAKEFQTEKWDSKKFWSLKKIIKGTEKKEEENRIMSAWFGRIVFPFILGYGFYQLLKPG